MAMQIGLDFYQAQMVGTLPTNLSSDVSYRGNAFTYEADTALGFSDLTGGWCTGGAVGELSSPCVKGNMHIDLATRSC